MPRYGDPAEHNAVCFLCGETYRFDFFTQKGIQNWELSEGRKCSPCRRANKESNDDRMDKYSWRSLKEIDATWGAVKRGELWEEALEAFARSLPVSTEQQDALIRNLK